MGSRQLKSKNLLILGTVLLLIKCGENKPSDYTMEAAFTNCAPIIDGTENDPIWQKITSVVLKDNQTGNEVQESGLQTHVKACYDASSLYFFLLCNDPHIWTSFT